MNFRLWLISIIGNSEDQLLYRWSLLINWRINGGGERMSKSDNWATFRNLMGCVGFITGRTSSSYLRIYSAVLRETDSTTQHWGSNYAEINVSMSAGLLDAGGIPDW